LVSRGDFFLKKYLPGKPTKWGIKAWGLADSANGYLLKCDIYKGKETIRQQDLLLGGNKLYYNVQKISGKNGIFISTIFAAPQI